MPISISKIRIHNFRSIEDLEVELGSVAILLGPNNSGKTNFLRALNLALGQNRTVSSEDIYMASGEQLDKKKEAYIDVMFVPTDSKGERISSFDSFWLTAFGDKWIQTNSFGENPFVGIRNLIKYDDNSDEYKITKLPILEWGDTAETIKVGGKTSMPEDMVESIRCFYMDAQRDIAVDLREKNSYFSKAMSTKDILPEKISNLEEELSRINREIVAAIPGLSQTKASIGKIASTIGAPNSTLEIEALANNLADLHRGMDIVFQDGNAATMSIRQHGMGTRSWISYLTLGAYVDWWILQRKKEQEAESYVLLTMEEPEANLHPQAQKQLYSQLKSFNGQKIISTHSPSVVAQADLSQLVHFEKRDGKTGIKKYHPSSEEENMKIKREILSSRGELLFASAVVLCEGITEEQALPVFFEHYFGFTAFSKGINIIGIGGQNYKAFVSLFNALGIQWFIFSDGEEQPIKSVKKAIKEIGFEQLASCPNVIVLDNGDDYEKSLIHSGCTEAIIRAINNVQNKPTYFDEYVAKNNHKSYNRHKTNQPPCTKCGQPIYEDDTREYDGDEGRQKAAYDCCISGNGKSIYAFPVAEEICRTTEKNNLPPKIVALFESMKRALGLEPAL